MTRSAAELLVACLAEQECSRVFTVPGESFLPVLDALHGHAGDRDRHSAARKAARRSWPAPTARSPAARHRFRHPRAGRDQRQHRRPRRVPGFAADDPVRRRRRARHARARGFQEIDFPRRLRTVAKWAARIDDAGAHPRIRRPRLCHGHLRPPGPGGAGAARGHAVATRPGDAAPRPSSIAGASALPRCADARSDPAGRRRRAGRDRRRRRLGCRGANLFPDVRRAARPPRRDGLPAAGRDSTPHRRSMPAISAIGPNPKLVERSRRPT